MVKSGNKLWATSPLSLTSKTAVVMLALGAPLVLLHLCDYVAQNTAGDSPNGKRDVMLFDIFCGKQALSSAYREQGYKTLSFDVELHPRCHDITSMTGFIRGIQYTLRLAEDSLLHGGPPCGTYVWVNRATSKRSGECPDGDASVPSVANANLITSRFALLMLLALCRCCFVAAEQPRSSLMPLSTPMDHLRLVLEGILPWNVQHFWMATWGSLTAKPSMSFGIAPFAAGLYRKFSKGKRLAVQKKLKKKNLQIVKQHVDAQGRKRVTGLKDLKKTQEYPKGYGKQVLKLHRDFVAQKPGFLREHLYGDDPAPTAAHANARQIIQGALSNDQNWLMAGLGDARAFLRAERARGKFTPVFDAGLDD